MARTRNAKRSRRRKGGNRFTRWLGFGKKKAKDAEIAETIRFNRMAREAETYTIKLQIADMEEKIMQIMNKLEMPYEKLVMPHEKLDMPDEE
jgi:hypothetical protein